MSTLTLSESRALISEHIGYARNWQAIADGTSETEHNDETRGYAQTIADDRRALVGELFAIRHGIKVFTVEDNDTAETSETSTDESATVEQAIAEAEAVAHNENS